MSDDEAALVRAVRLDPDDVPRLVLADYLEERGRAERAEFVRVQCRRAGLAFDDLLQGELWRREGELLAAHGRAWRSPFEPFMPDGDWHSLAFERGFVERVALRDNVFRDRFDALLRLAPVRSVRLFAFARPVHELAGLPGLAELAALDLAGLRGPAESLNQFLRHGRFDRLTTLRLPPGGPPAALAAALWSPGLPALADLDVTGTDLSGGGLADLLAPAPRGRLRSLGLRSCEIGPAQLWALADSPALEGVSDLDLYRGYPGRRGLDALAGSARLSELRSLGLEQLRVGDFDPDSLGRLFQSAHLARLEAVNLSGVVTGVSRAVTRATLPALAALDLGFNDLTATDLLPFLRSPAAAQLRRLVLDGNPLGRGGADALAGADTLTGLRSLSLAGCELGDAGVRSLARSPHLTGLVELNLNGNELGDRGATVLALADWPRLRALNLRNNLGLTPAGREALRLRFGGHACLT